MVFLECSLGDQDKLRFKLSKPVIVVYGNEDMPYYGPGAGGEHDIISFRALFLSYYTFYTSFIYYYLAFFILMKISKVSTDWDVQYVIYFFLFKQLRFKLMLTSN
jgi:hypothetical protein